MTVINRMVANETIACQVRKDLVHCVNSSILDINLKVRKNWKQKSDMVQWVNCSDYTEERASLVAQMVKCLPAVQGTRVRSLGGEDTLEKEMATHSSTLAWKIPWTEEPGRLQSMGSQRVGHD